MALLKIDHNPPVKVLKEFAMILPLLALIIGGIWWWKFDSLTVLAWLAAILVPIAIVGVIFPRAMRPIFVGWLYITFPIAWVISHTVLLFCFYVVIFPIALLLRAMGKDPLDRKWDPAAKSYWKKREPVKDPKQYFKQF